MCILYNVYVIIVYELTLASSSTAAIVDKVGFYLMVGWDMGDHGIRVLWNGGTQVYLRVQSGWAANLEGLCGNFDGDSKNDYLGLVSILRISELK